MILRRNMKLEKNELVQMYVTDKMSQRAIGTKLGITQTAVSYWIRKYGIPAQSKGGGHLRFDDLTERVFGRLTVLNIDKRAGEGTDRKSLWNCECTCGNKIIVWGNSLKNGLTQSCGCYRTDLLYKGYKDLSGIYWHRVVKGAKSRNLELSISIEDAWDKYESQNRKCALSGVDILLTKSYDKDRLLNTASLDRKDNDKGYSLENIQWVHKDINIMRNNFSIDEFLYWAEKVWVHNKENNGC